jgi:hypothetical protein
MLWTVNPALPQAVSMMVSDLLRVQHLHAEVDDPARGEVLALLTLGGFVDEVFKGLVHHIKVGIEELPLLQRADADLQVLRGEADFLVRSEDAFPFLLGFIEQVLQGLLGLRGGVDVAEAQMGAVLGVGGEFVVELGENELEDLFKDIDACVGEHFIFEVFNELAKATALAALSIALLLELDELINRPRLVSDLGDGFIGTRQRGDFLEVVRVLAVPDDEGCSVAPEGQRCCRIVGVTLELFFTVLEAQLLNLNDAVDAGWAICVHDHDVCTAR